MGFHLAIEIYFFTDKNDLDMLEHAEEFEEDIRELYPNFTCEIIDNEIKNK